MTPEETLAKLESIITADDNLLIWRSSKDSERKLFFIWSTKLGGGLAKGEPTLGDAIASFKRINAEALKKPRQKFFHSSSSPESRPQPFFEHASPGGHTPGRYDAIAPYQRNREANQA